MTFRQSEFARHYAQGKPAVKAALAAGYTQSTAETNAARLLKSPEVINEIPPSVTASESLPSTM